MATISLMPSDGEGPKKPRGFVPALASGYVAGYAAALDAGAASSAAAAWRRRW